MFNIIKADLYKYFKRQFLYILSILLIITSISLPLVLKFIDESAGTRINVLNICGGILYYIPILVIIFASVLSEEYSENTLKNTLPCNIPKVKYIMSKFMVQTLISIALLTISLLALLITTMSLKPGEGYTIDTVLNFILRVLSSLPIYIAGIAVVDFFVILFKKEVLVYIFYIMSILMFPPILKFMENEVWSGFGFIKEGLFIFALQPLTMQGATNKDMIFAIVLGIGYIILFSIINIKIFSRQEVK